MTPNPKPPNNAPRTFADLETAFEYRRWKRENAPDMPHHEAVRRFCDETGATYEKRKSDTLKAARELSAVIE